MSELTKEFNEAVKKHHDGYASIDLLVTHYAALRTFGAQTPEDKAQLAAALLDLGKSLVAPYTDPSHRRNIWSSDLKNAEQVFAALGEDAALLPRQTPAELNELALALLRKAENFKPDDFITRNSFEEQRAAYGALGKILFTHAKAFKTAAEERQQALETSKDFRAPKAIVLNRDPKPPGQ